MDAWSGPRAPRWRYMLLNGDDQPLGLLDGVTSARVTLVAQSRLGGSAEMTITDRGQDINWLRDRVQFIYDPGNGELPWPVGTFLFTSPTDRHSALTNSFSVTLTPKTTVIDSATVPAGFSIPAGTQIIPAVVQLIESTGESRIAVTESSATTTNLMVWEEGASKLTVVNDLLAAAGYWSLWCDGSGQFRLEPYVDPKSRPVSWRFEAGPASIHKPEWERTFNQAAVPNVYRVYCEGDESTPPIIGEASNEDPDSPYSIPSRGFEIGPPPERVEVASQVEADALAARRLLDAMSPVARLKARHAMVPVDLNQVVRFAPSKGPAVLATVQEMTIGCVFNVQVEAEWREILL